MERKKPTANTLDRYRMNVVNLHKNYDPSMHCDSAILEGIVAYWRGLCGARRMPARTDIDPVDINVDLLPHIMLIDIAEESPRLNRWRLLGTHITATLQRDFTGRTWGECYDEQQIQTIADRVAWVMEHKAPLRTLGHAVSVGRDFEHIETVYMPLSEDDDRVSMIFGGIEYTLGHSER